jgi:hypothetical protein
VPLVFFLDDVRRVVSTVVRIVMTMMTTTTMTMT